MSFGGNEIIRVAVVVCLTERVSEAYRGPVESLPQDKQRIGFEGRQEVVKVNH
jgi:hypothetical protein